MKEQHDDLSRAVETVRSHGCRTASINELMRAEKIAREVHAEQKDTVTGAPYVWHLQRVASLVEGEKAKAVAWLHDALEDVAWLTPDHLRMRGIGEAVITAVGLLTRTPPDDYAGYIERLRASGNPLAIAVKLADLVDHLTPNCPQSLRPRYVAALERLSSIDPRTFARIVVAAANSKANSSWQPIETAPKDFTKILVWSEALKEPTIAWWMGLRDMSEVSLEGWGPWGNDDGRWSLNDDEEPTHWMPLPQTPSYRALGQPETVAAVDPVAASHPAGPRATEQDPTLTPGGVRPGGPRGDTKEQEDI